MRSWLALAFGIVAIIGALSPAAAQRGAVYCNLTEIKCEQLSNGVRVSIVTDGQLEWHFDFERLKKEGAYVPFYAGGYTRTEKFTYMPFRLLNARSKLGSGFVYLGKYPVSHAIIRIPEWAREGVGLEVDVVNYVRAFSGEGDDMDWRYEWNQRSSEDRTSIVLTWTSDRFPPPPAPTTPTDFPSELEISSGSGGLSLQAVNAKVTEVIAKLASETGLSVHGAVDPEQSINLSLHDLSPEQALQAIAVGSSLNLGRNSDGSFVLSSGKVSAGEFQPARTRRVDLQYLRAIDALDLLPNFLLEYMHADRESNAIIVSGPEWMCERVAADLAKLDVRPPEIELEVVAIEYTSAAALAKNLRLERFLGDYTLSLNNLLGEMSIQWLPGLPRNWSALLQNNEVKTTSKLRSKATVRTLNGHTARIFGGEQRNLILQEIWEPTARIERVEIGASLWAQPRVGEGNAVLLHLELKMDNLSGTDALSGLPVIARRSADSWARIEDGETIAIAGLKMNEQGWERREIPILSKLPLVGALFRASERSQSETQLAIFVTPHIIRHVVVAGKGEV